jgi:hypothetical protein
MSIIAHHDTVRATKQQRPLSESVTVGVPRRDRPFRCALAALAAQEETTSLRDPARSRTRMIRPSHYARVVARLVLTSAVAGERINWSVSAAAGRVHASDGRCGHSGMRRSPDTITPPIYPSQLRQRAPGPASSSSAHASPSPRSNSPPTPLRQPDCSKPSTTTPRSSTTATQHATPSPIPPQPSSLPAAERSSNHPRRRPRQLRPAQAAQTTPRRSPHQQHHHQPAPTNSRPQTRQVGRADRPTESCLVSRPVSREPALPSAGVPIGCPCPSGPTRRE